MSLEIDAPLDYLAVLAQLHSYLKPKTYLEIGTHQGDSLRLASCASLSIDPQFQISADVLGQKPRCIFFQTTSDHFFAVNNPIEHLGGPIDLAFLDGMHLFEFLLRDFFNVEKYCRRNSVIAVHDAIPRDFRMAKRRGVFGEAWTGDIWKSILILKQYRPDIKMMALDAEPTGLVLCTNLNCRSALLEERYFDLVEEYSAKDLAILSIDRYRAEIDVKPPSVIDDFEMISAQFWM